MNKRLLVTVLLLVAAALLVSCAPSTAAPSAAPSAGKNLCTTTVLEGEKIDTIMGQLGYDMSKDALPPILVNGRLHDSPKLVNLTKGDVVSLANGLNCMEGYNRATTQYFDAGLTADYKGIWKDVSGFQRSLTPGEVDTLGSSLCENVLRTYYGITFSDLKSTPCNNKTVARYSKSDGTVSCQGYDSVDAAVAAVKSVDNIAEVKSLAIAVLTNPKENWSDNLCK